MSEREHPKIAGIAIDVDDSLVIAEGLSVKRLSPDGHVVEASAQLDAESLSSPTISDDGTIYGGASPATIYAFSPQLDVTWTADVPKGDFPSLVTEGPDGPTGALTGVLVCVPSL
jgi:hypothetical protein